MGISKLLDEPKQRVKELEKIVEQQARTIERMRVASSKAPKAKARRRGKSAFVRIIFGDVHGEHMDKAAVAAFLNDVEMLEPAEIVCVGDLIDCGGFLSQHKTLGVVAELAVSYEQDVAAANMLLDELQKRCPKATFTLIEGNHENRINRWIHDQVLGNSANADYLRRLFGPSAVLALGKRGIRFIERGNYYDDLSISGTIRLEPHAVANHGEAFCGKYSAFRHLERLGKSAFFGHSHRLTAVYGENLDGQIVAVNTGCLCQLRPMYRLTQTTDWQQGFVAQFCEPGSGFLALPVPIINGTSYLSPLLKMVN